MDKFDGKSTARHTGDVIPVDLIEETSIEENRHKVVSLLKEAIEVLEKGQQPMAKDTKEEFDIFKLGYEGLIDWVERTSKENEEKEREK